MNLESNFKMDICYSEFLKKQRKLSIFRLQNREFEQIYQISKVLQQQLSKTDF